MGNDSNIKRYTVDELRAMQARGESQTDWARLDAITEAELERAIAEDPDSDPALLEPPPGWPMFSLPTAPKAPKKLISLRLDQEVVDFFKAQGAGYQTMMNGVLLNYVRAWKQAVRLAEEKKARQAGKGPSSA
jgi:uncharacterized protein (DUF4415 family)